MNSSLDFGILKGVSPDNVLEESNLQEGGNIKDIAVDKLGNLTPVEDLDNDLPDGENTEDDPSTEGISVEIITDEMDDISEETSSRLQTSGVKKALQKLQQATGLNFDQPQPKPPPSIVIDKGVCRAYLQGMCYLTMAPLIHLLINSREEDVFEIEVDTPYVNGSDLISLATAISSANAKVNVNVRRIGSMYDMMLLATADNFHVAPNVHTVGPMSGFAMGSVLDLSTTTKAFEEHEDYVQKVLVERGFISEEDLDEINEKAKRISFTTEELLERIKSD